ncbi:MAG: squalene--hopene cyclase [Planctomycetota bacterium]
MLFANHHGETCWALWKCRIDLEQVFRINDWGLIPADWQATQRAWQATLWANPNFVRAIAVVAVALMVITIWLFRRRRRSGHAAATICLTLSVILHIALIIWVPKMTWFQVGGSSHNHGVNDGGDAEVSVSMWADSEADWMSMPNETRAESEPEPPPMVAPLPIADSILQPPELQLVENVPSLTDSVETQITEPDAPNDPSNEESNESPAQLSATASMVGSTAEMPASLASSISPTSVTDDVPNQSIDDDPPLTDLDAWLADQLADPTPEVMESPENDSPDLGMASNADVATANTSIDSFKTKQDGETNLENKPKHQSGSFQGHAFKAGRSNGDFASRTGEAKQRALEATGGDANTEMAVAAALDRLSELQRDDGSWDPATSGGGLERMPLGITRPGAGRHAKTAVTGLSLLAYLGAGHTHQSGDYQQTIYRGLVYLLNQQRSDGSLAGSASVYGANYSHAMATLAMAEAAAMTQDDSAKAATRRAMRYTFDMQHPVTGGWRYTKNDPGDLSQLGWHVMSIDAAQRAGAIDNANAMLSGARRFLQTVRAGQHGGLACYRPGEAPTSTMTAEAMATRLLINDRPSDAALREGSAMLLRNLPPPARMQASTSTSANDNFYGWYYATLALHQLQDEAWRTWNQTLKERLLATQQPDGSWSTNTLWGGYGGQVYTTAMATLCLETYYRHQIR